MNKIEILKAARALLADKGVARNGLYYDEDRDCFCSIGAIRKVAGGKVDAKRGMVLPNQGADFEATDEAIYDLLADVRKTSNRFIYITTWNDRTADDDEVLAMFDATIARLESA